MQGGNGGKTLQQRILRFFFPYERDSAQVPSRTCGFASLLLSDALGALLNCQHDWQTRAEKKKRKRGRREVPLFFHFLSCCRRPWRLDLLVVPHYFWLIIIMPSSVWSSNEQIVRSGLPYF